MNFLALCRLSFIKYYLNCNSNGDKYHFSQDISSWCSTKPTTAFSSDSAQMISISADDTLKLEIDLGAGTIMMVQRTRSTQKRFYSYRVQSLGHTSSKKERSTLFIECF